MTKRSDRDLAAGLALGTLDAETHKSARIRVIEDRNFAAEAAKWEQRLAPLALSEEAEPLAGLFAKIEARIAERGSELPGTITRRAGTGDFHIAHAGRHHPVHRTRTGCICIISQAVD